MVQTSKGWPTRYAGITLMMIIWNFIGAIKLFPLMDDYWDL